MMLRSFLTLPILTSLLWAHNPALHSHRIIEFPDLENHLTLVCDLHTHSVFSDGSVWPDIRVEEAQRDGLDALAITEHLEIQDHLADIPHPDRNRSYELASGYSEDDDVLIINGSEITRDMPPGHANAIFLTDANQLKVDDYMEAFKAAKQQGAFVFWNHPHWIGQSPNADIPLDNIHKHLIRRGFLRGIEVVNDLTYSDKALQTALDYNLTIIGTSDIHTLADWRYKIPEGNHRPVTLVFAKEKSKEAIKKALFDKQTVVWYNNILIGRKTWLQPLLEASLFVGNAGYYQDKDVAVVTLVNRSDAKFVLRNLSVYGFYVDSDLVEVPAQGMRHLGVVTGKRLGLFELQFEVLNAITAPGTHPRIKIQVRGADQKRIDLDL